MTMVKKHIRHTESTLQRNCVRWFRYQWPNYALNLIAIPNGGARSVVEAAIMKGEGVTAGAADLFFFYPSGRYHGLAIEMKSMDGTWRESQKKWAKAIEDVGYKYVLCRSFEQFVSTIEDYIAGNLI